MRYYVSVKFQFKNKLQDTNSNIRIQVQFIIKQNSSQTYLAAQKI